MLEDPRTGWADRLRDANRAETAISDWWSQEQILFVPAAMRVLASIAEEALCGENLSHGPRESRDVVIHCPDLICQLLFESHESRTESVWLCLPGMR